MFGEEDKSLSTFAPCDVICEDKRHGGTIAVGRGKNGKGKTKVPCFTKKQLNTFHPKKGWKIAAEIRAQDFFLIENKRQRPLPSKGYYNRLLWTEGGYLGFGGGKYAAILKPFFTLWLAAFILIAAVFSGIWFFLPKTSDKSVDKDKIVIGIPLDPDALPYDPNATGGKGNPNATQSDFNGFKELRVKKSDGALQNQLHNREGNPGYIVFSVLLDEKVLYQSKWVEPGYAISGATLDLSGMQPGTYRVLLKHEVYHLTTHTRMNGMDMPLDLVVEP